MYPYISSISSTTLGVVSVVDVGVISRVGVGVISGVNDYGRGVCADGVYGSGVYTGSGVEDSFS